MEAIPVEVIGNILSLVAAARDVIVASTVCKKWRDAAQRHLRTLRFSTMDWPAYASGEITTKELEVLITQTILQTTSLSQLSISIGGGHKFSAAPVIAWLMYTKETLQSLTYMMYADSGVNILDRCGRNKLETLALGHVNISKIDLGIHRFPSLISLTLKRVSMSSLDSNLILSACPKLEKFSLINSDPTITDGNSMLELSSNSLRAIEFEDLNMDNVRVVVDAENLQNLCVKYCTFEHLELLNRKSIRFLKMAHCNIFQLDLGEATDELETVDISGFTLTWTKLHPMLLRANRLKSLRLWASPEVDENILDLETLATCFPQLNRLSLSYELSDDSVLQLLRGSSKLSNVAVLEVGSDLINGTYATWISSLLQRCPRLRRLIVSGRLSEASDHEDFQKIASFTSTIVDLMRQYIHVQIQFQFY